MSKHRVAEVTKLTEVVQLKMLDSLNENIIV
jgi:hypothetical protein